ncbi:MAG: hypothetical protein JST92_25050 [Deltaproteobacteria bacterium]|nr:hypothetical protein [Deltaproteobacteria bacterium]
MTMASAGAAAEAAKSDIPIGQSVVPCPLATSFIELKLTQCDGSPMAGIKYTVLDSSKHPQTGQTDAAGSVKLNVRPGTCEVSFDAPPADDRNPVAGAQGKFYLPDEPPVTCATDQTHVFYVGDWGTKTMKMDSLRKDELRVRGQPEVVQPSDVEEFDIAGVKEST